MSEGIGLIELRKELVGLMEYVTRVRQEIAAIDRPAEEEHAFESMSDQLDAIVKATEGATHTIMEAVERNTDTIERLRARIGDSELARLLDDVTENQNIVLQACAFQDITGQRITKVVRSLSYLETRVANLVAIWGRDALKEVEVKPDREKTDDEKLLHGPQDPDKALAQAEIDALFD